MAQFSFGFYSLMLTSLLLGLIVMVLYKPRTCLLYTSWFCRVEKKEGDSSAPFKPLALLNYPMIDEKLGQIAVDFWETT